MCLTISEEWMEGAFWREWEKGREWELGMVCKMKKTLYFLIFKKNSVINKNLPCRSPCLREQHLLGFRSEFLFRNPDLILCLFESPFPGSTVFSSC